MKKKWIFLLLAIWLLAGCGTQAQPLTEAEIAKANQAFAFLEEVTENGETKTQVSRISCFFTSFYAEPSELDLAEFLRYCPVGTILEDRDQEEYLAVLAALDIDPEPFPMPGDYIVPVHRYRKADVSALLEAYAGITAEDLPHTEGILYLEVYDAYYNFTSDFGPGMFTCTGGERQGDTLRFWSEPVDGVRKVLTVKKADGAYRILSFLEENMP